MTRDFQRRKPYLPNLSLHAKMPMKNENDEQTSMYYIRQIKFLMRKEEIFRFAGHGP